jgi:hypothetical protein
MSVRTPPPMYTAPSFPIGKCGYSHPTARPKPRRVCALVRPGNEFGVGEEGSEHASTGREERHEASSPVRAREGLGPRARRIGERGGRDRCADGQQGAGAKRRGDGVVEALTRGHLVRAAWWPAQRSQGAAGTHARSAVRGGEGPEPPRPIEDDESRAAACARGTAVTDGVPSTFRPVSSRVFPTAVRSPWRGIAPVAITRD